MHERDVLGQRGAEPLRIQQQQQLEEREQQAPQDAADAKSGRRALLSDGPEQNERLGERLGRV